jgi:hypothetical protein
MFVAVSLVAALLVAEPVAARMFGGASCIQSQDKVYQKEPLILSYQLTCGDDQAEVSEKPGEGSALAKVKRAGNTYLHGIRHYQEIDFHGHPRSSL